MQFSLGSEEKRKRSVAKNLKMSRVKLSHESAAEAGPVIIGMLCATSMYLSNVYMQRGGGSLQGVSVTFPVTFTFWVVLLQCVASHTLLGCTVVR